MQAMMMMEKRSMGANELQKRVGILRGGCCGMGVTRGLGGWGMVMVVVRVVELVVKTELLRRLYGKRIP
jgi:hypothetical protein